MNVDQVFQFALRRFPCTSEHSLRATDELKRKVILRESEENEKFKRECESSNLSESSSEIFMLFSFAADVNWSSCKNQNGEDPYVNFLILLISHSLYKGM
jgi:hypothetical protein